MDEFLLKSQKYWAWIVLPIINIPAWFMADPLFENMTHIAYAKHHFPFVFLWAVSCSLYFWCYTRLLWQRIGTRKKSAMLLLTLSCLLMIVSVCIPYQKEAASALSQFHINMAMLATVAYIILFLFILCRLLYQKPLLWQRIITPYLGVIGLLLLLLLIMGHVSTLLETLFVMSMGIYHWWLQKVLSNQ